MGPTEICSESPAQFNVLLNGLASTYEWEAFGQQSSGPFSFFQPNFVNPSLTAVQEFPVNLKASNRWCEHSSSIDFTLKPKPVASFELVGVSSGCQPFDVRFRNTSFGNPTNGMTYTYDFGSYTTYDTSGDDIVLHTYYNSGGQDSHFYPTLTAVNDWGCVSNRFFREGPIIVHPYIKADFRMSVNEGYSPLEVNFRNISEGHYYFVYDFGYGIPISGERGDNDHTHIFEAPNMSDTTFIVLLTVTRGECSHSSWQSVRVLSSSNHDDLCIPCASHATSGVSETLKWVLCSDGILTFVGTGVIQNFATLTSYRSFVTGVVICDGIRTIENNAFGDFINMTYVTIPTSVTSIGNSAFSNCRNLTSVEIPSSIRAIGNNAFANCIGLSEIINHATTPQTIHSHNVFDKVDKKTCILYVPDASVKDYSVANGWKQFNIRSDKFATYSGTAFLEGTIAGIDTSDSITIHLYIRDSDLLKSTSGYTLVASILVPANGQYKFENLPEGVYIMQIVFDDFESTPSEAINLTEGAIGGSVDFSIDVISKTVTPDPPNVYTAAVENLYTPNLKIYPNPTNGLFTLEFETANIYVITIRDIAGRVLLHQSVTDQKTQIDISNYSAGTYLLTISNGKAQSTTRIVKN